MTQRKAIVHIGPQETGFFGGLFDKHLGGYNWEFDRKGNFVRRPGTVKFTSDIMEVGVLGIAQSSSASQGIKANTRHGIRLARFFNRPNLTNAPFSGPVPDIFLLSNDATTALGVRTASELMAVGAFPWRVNLLRFAIATVDITVKVRDIAGVKTVTFALLSGSSAPVSFSATTSIGTVIDSLGGSLLTAIQNIEGSYYADMSGWPYGDAKYDAGDSLVSFVPSVLPFSEFMYLGVTYTGTAIHNSIDFDPAPKTSCQIGDYLYVAGTGGPLLRYDGSRMHVAGASPLTAPGVTPAISALGGTGITGTYQYKMLHRVYGPNGTYTDGPVYDLGSVSPANQTVTWTISRQATAANMVVNGSWPLVGSASDGLSRSLAAMYKCTDFTYNGLTPNSGGADFRLTRSGFLAGVKNFARLEPGDPIFQWDGTTLSKGSITKRYVDGGVGLSLSPVATSIFCAGDVYVFLRTVAGGTIYYERAEVPVGAATFADSLSDGSLTALPQYLDTAYYRGQPPLFTVAVCEHQQRLVVAHRQDVSSTAYGTAKNSATELSWTEPGTEHFPPENNISLAGEISKITGLASLGDLLYILTERGIFYVSGALVSPETFTLQQIPTAPPNLSPAGVLITPRGVEYLSSEGGIVVLSGGQVAGTLSRDLDPTSYLLDQVVAFYSEKEQKAYFIAPQRSDSYAVSSTGYGTAVAVGTSDGAKRIPLTSASGCVVINYLKKALKQLYLLPFSPSSATSSPSTGAILSTIEAGLESSIKSISVGSTSDEGNNIPVVIQSAFEDGESPHLHKTFSALTVFAPDATSQFALDVKVEKDWDERRYIQEFSMDFKEDQGCADIGYAEAPYGDGVIPERVQPLNNFKAKSCRITLEHNDKTETPVINGWVLEYSDTTREGREQ